MVCNEYDIITSHTHQAHSFGAHCIELSSKVEMLNDAVRTRYRWAKTMRHTFVYGNDNMHIIHFGFLAYFTALQ